MKVFSYYLRYIGSIATVLAFFGQGNGPISRAYVRCAGTEARLVNCSSSSSVRYCSHYEDAGVRCHIQTGILATNLLEL